MGKGGADLDLDCKIMYSEVIEMADLVGYVAWPSVGPFLNQIHHLRFRSSDLVSDLTKTQTHTPSTPKTSKPRIIRNK